MKYSQAGRGRTFIIRLEDGEILHEQVEELARRESVKAAVLVAVGGADDGSRLVVGPREGRERPVQPVEESLHGVHELAGAGTVFPDEEGRPVLHMHVACGRKSSTVTGCVRAGVKTWKVMEVVLIELTGCGAARAFDPATGFKLLEP